MRINTQAAFGSICGRVKNGALELSAAGSFSQPSAADIFSCGTGPFATGNKTERNVVIPRLAAAFNLTTLLLCDEHPNDAHKGQYYKETIANHYSRVVHEASVDGRGYVFLYGKLCPGAPLFGFSGALLTIFGMAPPTRCGFYDTHGDPPALLTSTGIAWLCVRTLTLSSALLISGIRIRARWPCFPVIDMLFEEKVGARIWRMCYLVPAMT